MGYDMHCNHSATKALHLVSILYTVERLNHHVLAERGNVHSSNSKVVLYMLCLLIWLVNIRHKVRRHQESVGLVQSLRVCKPHGFTVRMGLLGIL